MHLIHEDLARAQIRARVEAARCRRTAEKLKRNRRQEQATGWRSYALQLLRVQ
jgi:hypothetical protein